jgi:hypothetical protein
VILDENVRFYLTSKLYLTLTDLYLQANDTLDDHMCPNAGDSDAQTATWTSTYTLPITTRLNAHTSPPVNLTGTDIYNLQSLCAFDTLQSPSQTLSPFCGLFTTEEFKDFAYTGDIDKYYNTGPGQALGPVQGVGYINELIARLTSSPVRDHTQTNTTLDSNLETFPLDKERIYVDFSHDNSMIPVYSAMGLFEQEEPLDLKKRHEEDQGATWIVGKMVPFSGRMVTELVSCTRKSEKEKGSYVRVLVSNVVQPLKFCGASDDGLCTLEKFVESQRYARNDGDGDFEKCFN